MIITLNRNGNGKLPTDVRTIGIITTPKNKVFTLEDDYDDVKVKGHTRIPAGEYEIILRKAGTIYEKYVKRFGSIMKGIPWLQNVTNYEYVYIHCGNTEKDTSGCILVGIEVDGDRLYNSTLAFVKIYTEILDCIESGNRVFIKIID